jgi:cytochrome P450 family 6
MTFALYELSIDEELQEKARHSVLEAVKKHGGLTYDAVADMKFLEQCVSETLRKYPVVPQLQRMSVKDYQIPNTSVVIPKGQTILISTYGIHHDPEIYPEPEKFDPDRFTPDKIKSRHPMSWMPFGEGPRTCIGMRFAMFEGKLGLAKLLMKYKFKLDRSKTSVPLIFPSFGFSLTPKENLYLDMEKIAS